MHRFMSDPRHEGDSRTLGEDQELRHA
jgi:hypothetical protein